MALGIRAFLEIWVDYKLYLGYLTLQSLCLTDEENNCFYGFALYGRTV